MAPRKTTEQKALEDAQAKRQAAFNAKLEKFYKAQNIAQDNRPTEFVIGEEWGISPEVTIQRPSLIDIETMDRAERNLDIFTSARVLFGEHYDTIINALNESEHGDILLGMLVKETQNAIFGTGVDNMPGGQ